MNANPQLEFHPDAESLSAFAEKALPERERGQIMDHLAGCSRCRQVIFLARQAAAEMEMAAVPAAQATRRRSSWLNGWGLAWIPAVALAGVIGLAFLVHGRHEETGTEMAKATASVAPQDEASIKNPLAKNQEEARKEHAPARPVAEKQLENKGESASVGAAYIPAQAEAAQPPAAASETNTVTPAPPQLQTPSASFGQVLQMEPLKQAPAPSAYSSQRAAGSYSSNSAGDHAAKARMDDRSERFKASGKAEARYGGSGGGLASQYKKDAAPSSSYDAGGSMPDIHIEAAPRPSNASLPSGLNIVSSVTAQNHMLAIDEAGALFLSMDSGGHWESVFRQWTGRAVDVNVLPNSNGSTEIFELRNDKNLIWVSSDGMIWTAK